MSNVRVTTRAECATTQPATGTTQQEALQRPRRLGGFGLSSVVLLSPFAFIASVAASAAQPGSHPLSVDTLPAASSLRQWLHAALTSPTVSALPLPSDTLHLSTTNCVHLDADTFAGHYHSYPDQAAGLQSSLMTAATHSLYNARLSEVKRAGDLRGQARLCGGRAPYASRWRRYAQPRRRTSWQTSTTAMLRVATLGCRPLVTSRCLDCAMHAG